MSQIIPKVSASDLAAVADLADENIITEDELSLVGSGAQGGFAFDGNDYLSGTSDDFGTSDFTIVYDLLWDDAPTGVEYIARSKVSGNNRWEFWATATQYRLLFVNNSGGTTTSTWTVTPSVNHRNVIVSADRSGNATLYLNGASQGTQDISATSSVNFGSGNTGAQYIANSGSAFDGKMFQVRYYTEAKTSEQVANIAKGHNDTDNLFLKLAPTSTNESGWTDVSGNNRSFTANGVTRIESNISKNYTSHSEYTAWQKKDGGFKYDGSDDYSESGLSLAGASTFSILTTFTCDDLSSAKIIASDYGANNYRSWQLNIQTSGKLRLNVYDGTTTNYTVAESSLALSTGTQYTVGVVRAGISDVTFFINGEQVVTTYTTGGNGAPSTLSAGTGTFRLARDQENNNELDGTIHEARIFNYALSENDVQEYSRGAATKFVDKIDTTINWLRENEDVAAVTAGATITTNSNRAINISNPGGGTKFVNFIGPNGSTTEWALYKRYRFSGTVNSITGSIAFGGFEGPDIQINSTGNFSYDIVFDNDVNGLLFLGISDGEAISISNMVIELVGETASYLPTSATESIWEDCSGLSNHATNSGATLLSPSLQETYTTNQELVSSRVGTRQGYYFNGSNAKVEPGVSLQNYTDFTFVTDIVPEIRAGLNAIYADYTNTSSYSLAYGITSSGTIRFLIADGTISNYTQWDTTYSVTAGEKYTLVIVRDGQTSAHLYINGKKVDWSNISTTGTGAAAVMPLATTPNIGANNITSDIFKGLINRHMVINRALTASEVSQISRGQRLGFADVGADGTTDADDYSAGTDSWSINTGSTLTGNNDGVNDGTTSKDNVLNIISDASTGGHSAIKAYMSANKRYRLKIVYYIPTSNTSTTGINVRTGGGQSLFSEDVTGSWVTKTLEFTNTTSTYLVIYMRDGAGITFTGTSGDLLHIAEFEVTQLGEVLALLPTSAATGKWYNEGGSGSSGDGTVTGATLINERKRGVFDNLYLDNVPSSDAGLVAGEVYRDNNGHLKIVI